MEIDDKVHFKYKLDYLKLALKISRLRYQAEEPPKKLLQQAQELGSLAGVSEEELNNL